MIELERVSRWYGDVIGLNDVTATIGPGITALLGMNGAGKSTLMRLVTGQLQPTTGDLRIFGMQPFANPAVFRRLGYCPEIDNFYEHRSGRDFVNTMARMDGFSARDAKARTEEVLGQTGMADRAAKPMKGYSKGMRQRIKLAQAMLHDPDVILLDEPLNGLDPVGRKEYIDLLAALGEQGKCVVVSSHILFEVEQMTRDILLLHRGRLLASGDLRVIRDLMDRHPHKVRIVSEDPRRIAARLLELPYVLSADIAVRGGELEVRTKEPDVFYPELSRLTLDENLPVRSFESPDNDLESVFRYLVS